MRWRGQTVQVLKVTANDGTLRNSVRLTWESHIQQRSQDEKAD